jgi:hypothetical protein
MSVDADLILNEVRCSECNRPIPAIPHWLSDAAVKFQCEECRQKHPRIPTLEIDPRRAVSDVDELVDVDVVDDVEDDEDADEELDPVEEAE